MTRTEHLEKMSSDVRELHIRSGAGTSDIAVLLVIRLCGELVHFLEEMERAISELEKRQ